MNYITKKQEQINIENIKMALSKTNFKAISKMYELVENNTILDKKILSSVEKEKSVFGKELLLCKQMHIVYHELPKKSAKEQIILYLIRLFKYNMQVHESVLKELANDQKLLKQRINKSFKEKEVHKEIYKNLSNMANYHFDKSVHHFSIFKKDPKKEHHHHMIKAHHHKAKAEELYNTLLGKDIKKITKLLALKKLSIIYDLIVKKSESVADNLGKAIKAIDSKKPSRKNINTLLTTIHKEIMEENLNLRHFALNYSKSMIHSAEYIDNIKNKIILYHHKK